MMMAVVKRYRQLKLDMNVLEDQYPDVVLHFKMRGKEVNGVLRGSISDWTFESYSADFTKIVPSGQLHKYMLWWGKVPKGIGRLYNSIFEAALKAGYELEEKEEISLY